MASGVGLGPVFAFEWRRPFALRVRDAVADGAAARGDARSYAWPALRPAGGDERGLPPADLRRASFSAAAGLGAAAAGDFSVAAGSLARLCAPTCSTPRSSGKLAARLRVLGMILCVAPVLAIATLFGGVAPVALIGALLSCCSPGQFFGCSLSPRVGLGRDARGADGDRRRRHPLPAGRADRRGPPGDVPRRRGGRCSSLAILRQHHPLGAGECDDQKGGLRSAAVTIGTHATFLGMGPAASAVLIGAATWRVRGGGDPAARPAAAARQARHARGVVAWADRPRSARAVGPGHGLAGAASCAGVADAVADRTPRRECRRAAPCRVGASRSGDLTSSAAASASSRSP